MSSVDSDLASPCEKTRERTNAHREGRLIKKSTNVGFAVGCKPIISMSPPGMDNDDPLGVTGEDVKDLAS